MSLSIDDSIKWVKGVGPARAELLKNCDIKTVRDFLYYPPRRYLDRSDIKSICDIEVGKEVTVEGDIISVSSRKTRNGTLISDVVIYDGTGMLNCRWFNQKWVEKRFKKGEHLFVSGKTDYYKGLQIVNPDYEFLTEEESKQVHTGGIIPLYPLTKGLGQRFMRRTIGRILKEVKGQIEDSMPEDIIRKHNLIPLNKAISNLHFPESKKILNKSIKRLAFNEIFYLQLFLAIRKIQQRKKQGIKFDTGSELENKFISELPFDLTESQKKVLNEIKNDMQSNYPMNRLLQGDVGSGKTVVAIAAMLIAVDNGFSSVLMAPTEILASQHYLVVKELLSHIDIHCYLLTGGINQEERENILDRISKERGILIGTHALLEEDVEIQDVGFVVIDEQHRFGVTQRAVIKEKGEYPDTLVMTATPIPRTLALTVYGELEISTIEEMPPGRVSPVSRWVRKVEKRARVYEWVRERIKEHRIKAYIVFPLIEESEKMNLKSIEQEADNLQNDYFRDLNVGILHGRMSNSDKENIMKSFRGEGLDVLISTTVVEVGLDIPEANIMVVENADRFGLAQLHQLRGRIGRAGEKSYFIMIASEEDITENAKVRLSSIENNSDGFSLAEIDLKLRGPGEFFGTRQHGFPDFKFFQPFKDRRMIGRVRNTVKDIINRGIQNRFKDELIKIRKSSEYIDIG